MGEPRWRDWSAVLSTSKGGLGRTLTMRDVRYSQTIERGETIEALTSPPIGGAILKSFATLPLSPTQGLS
jgi:hypothetical protein